MKDLIISDKIFILLLLFLMPIDFFNPTAYLLREAGAKPFNIFVLFFLLGYIGISRNICWKFFLNKANLYLSVILILGSAIFIININFILLDYPVSNRTPGYQFFSQFSMFLLFILVLNILRLYFSKDNLRQYVINIMPIVVFSHILIFSLEFFSIFNHNNSYFISYFRNNAGLIDRASGLMSEPSYFGAFAGLFAIPLILICKKNRILNIVMSIILVLISVIIQAKTFFIVIFIQMIFFFFGSGKSVKHKFLILCFAIPLIVFAIYTMNTTLVFNLDQNLSSANRLGSGLLALNVASSGYGFLGLGFGQFHFFYLPEFSPDFLFYSQEAMDQMNNVNDTRASTFSLPLRLLVETGIFGLLAAILLISTLFKKYGDSKDSVTQAGLFFISGSIGFLLTQDTYCLPSLALGLALVISQPISAKRDISSNVWRA